MIPFRSFRACRRALAVSLLALLPALAAPGAEKTAAPSGRLRIYFIAADEVDWNYAPAGNVLADLHCCSDDPTWLKRGPNGLPPIFKKAVFREYTDATFTHLKPRAPEWEHLGILGPVIRAEVGDRIEVTLRNNAAFSVSLHPHGVHYDKANEGAGYPDGTKGADKADDDVPPHGTYTYHWDVPARSGPGPGDPSSVVWLYHSHIDSPRDTNTGLIGVIIVTRQGEARPDGAPKDVDREFVTLFSIFDEGASNLASQNLPVLTFADSPGEPGEEEETGERQDVNLFHSINGFIFGNLPMPRMKVGEHVRWYLVSLGGEMDLHTPHWHGNTVLAEGRRTDVIELLPASMKVADMRPDDPGIWLYHCHVNDHIRAGMAARYEVDP